MTYTRGVAVSLVTGLFTFAALQARAHGPDVHDYYPKARAYTATNCIVSDDVLGSHGKPYVFTHKGQQFKLCCKSCLKEFKKEPARFVRKLETFTREKR